MSIKTIIISIFCLLVFEARLQDSKKITNLLGKDFKELPTSNSVYAYAGVNNIGSFQLSATVEGDTTGFVLNNEYVLFRHPISHIHQREQYKFIKTNHVTVGEYLEFYNYVVDSIRREKLYHHFMTDGSKDEARKMLIDKSKSISLTTKRTVPFDYNYIMEEFDLQMISEVYFPWTERLNKERRIDSRKINYHFKYNENNRIIENLVSTISDTYQWASLSKHNRDEYSILGQLYNNLLTSAPVVGFTGTQAKAFCHWKQQQIQQSIDKIGVNYQVVVALPTIQEIPQIARQKFNIPERDYTQQWQITVGEYQEFIAAVRDSILREEIYWNTPILAHSLKLLNYKSLYFDEIALEFVEIDPADKHVNREYFYLNKKTSLKKFSEITTVVQQRNSYKFPIYTYRYIDAFQKSIEGKFGVVEDQYTGVKWLNKGDVDALNFSIGKDLIMDSLNTLGHSSGVRTHLNERQFIITQSIAVLPPVQSLQKKSNVLMEGLTYEQALAFYNWKYPTCNVDSKENWQKYVLPSEAQFHQIQRGEKIILPAKTIDFPTPIFRYVVHLFERTTK